MRPISFRPSSREVLVGCDAKPVSIQGLVQKIARAVAGEHAAGAIRAVRSGRQPDEQQPRAGIAKSRHRLGPIIPIAIGAALHASHFGAIGNQPRAAHAGDDFAIQDFERIQPTG